MGKHQSESIFSLDDFRSYVKAWARARGRGEFRKISQALGMHTTLVSQVLHGRKCLTEEQAVNLCGYMSLNPLETDYFLKLVQLERAGTVHLKNLYQRHLRQIQSQANEVKSRVPESKELSEQDRALFYSSWQYSFVRLLTSIESFQTTEKIAFRLNLSVSRTQEILDFLTSRGLCNEDRGKYRRTGKNTHVESQSPLAVRHHQNWRTKSLELVEMMTPDDLAFTAPVSIAKRDIEKVRSILLETIADVANIVEDSASEEMVYFGIDWIKV